MEITIPYYKDLSRISNSNIGWFLNKGPQYLRDMLDGKEEGLKGSFLEKGTMIHMYLLQEDEFWNNYTVLNFETPSSKQQLTFAETYVNTTEIEPNSAVLSAYRSAYSTTGIADEKVLVKGLELVEKLKDYIEYLKMCTTDKKVISFADVNMLKRIKQNVQSHKLANKLLYDIPTTSEAHNELHINWEFPRAYDNIHLACKSLIDRCIFDHTLKKITLIDVKTTCDVNNFKHSVDEFKYGRQLAFYWFAIQWYMLNVKGINVFKEDYTFETYIVAIQNNGNNSVRAFKFKPEAVELEISSIEYAVKEIIWHTKNNLWQYRREYYEGDGAEEI